MERIDTWDAGKHRIEVLEEIEFNGKKLAPGRRLRVGNPNSLIDKYGAKVQAVVHLTGEVISGTAEETEEEVEGF